MRVRIHGEAGSVDLQTPGSYHPEVLRDLNRQALGLYHGLVCVTEHTEEDDSAVVEEPTGD